MSTWKLAKRVIGKKWEEFQIGTPPEVLPTQDETLPLGGRIGGLMTLPGNPFLRASIAGSITSAPKEALVIVAISRIRLSHLEGMIYRYYTQIGDSSEKESFLQVVTGADQSILEVAYFENLVRFHPSTPADINRYKVAGADHSGKPQWGLSHSDLAGVLLPEILSRVTEAGVVYDRSITPSDASIAPIEATEVRIDDRIGEQGLKQQVWLMQYARAVGTSTEVLYVSLEVPLSRNGQQIDQVPQVDFAIGITIDPSAVNII